MSSTETEFSRSYTNKVREVRRIFGKKVELICRDKDIKDTLFRELFLYQAQKLDENETVDFILEIVPKFEIVDRLDDFKTADFLTLHSKVSVSYFIFEDGRLKHILFALIKPVNNIHGWVQRFRNMGYNRREERVGQIIHEQVLVPSVLFNKDAIPIHSSAVKYKDQVILFGGHGGVGKTSLELELCFHNGAHFIADDISVVSLDGDVYPNLSFPKIYGYNIEGQPEIKKRIFDSFDTAEAIHWKLHKLKGLNKVRRRIAPSELYENYLNTSVKGDRYMILNRYNGKEIKSEKISTGKAAEISINILKKEFSQAFDGLGNIENHNMDTYKSDAILNRWQRDLPRALSDFQCEIIHIPESIPHEQFKEEMLKIFS